jgi:oligopeptidase A
MTLGNPLLEYRELPQFDRIAPEHAQPAIGQILADGEAALVALEGVIQPSWDASMVPLRDLLEPLGFAWGVIAHLHSVMNTPAWREAHDALQPQVVAFSLRVSQSQPVYHALAAIRDNGDWSSLSTARQRVVANALLQAELAGVGLPDSSRERFNELKRELAQASTRFTNNLLDATKAYALRLDTREDVAGLPASLLVAASEAARQRDMAESTPENGPWLITLEMPVFSPFMQYSERRDHREALYCAFVSRASKGETDNTALIDTILTLRRELAHLLGYASHAEVSLARKMADDVDAVDALIARLRAAAYPAARRELNAMRAFAAEHGQAEPLMNWDVPFWSERMREAKFGFSSEDLRPYFQFPRVLEGLFGLVQQLFGIMVARADGEAPVWQKDVGYFSLQDASGNPIASFYLDPYSRPATKRGGAWMDSARTRYLRTDDTLTLPAAYLVCNQTLPADGNPSLMTFNEVTTLFHEFGHALQHILTTVNDPEVAGVHGVEWDAVELPSQFMENWCYHRSTLLKMSCHVETGEPLPDELYTKLCEARTFMAGTATLRQLLFAALDIELHHRYDPGAALNPNEVKCRIGEDYTHLPFIESDRFLCGFAHIFAGGYAAGYYSYKWAEVLSADAFAVFEEAGLDDVAATTAAGRRFMDTVLALGGSQHPMEVFKAFRGREPDPDALLRHDGLI